MKKLSYITTIIFIICLFAIPSKGFTELTLLTESELGHITAQAGFSDALDVFGIKHDEKSGSFLVHGVLQLLFRASWQRHCDLDDVSSF